MSKTEQLLKDDLEKGKYHGEILLICADIIKTLNANLKDPASSAKMSEILNSEEYTLLMDELRKLENTNADIKHIKGFYQKFSGFWSKKKTEIEFAKSTDSNTKPN
jgi:hypothetical protein